MKVVVDPGNTPGVPPPTKAAMVSVNRASPRMSHRALDHGTAASRRDKDEMLGALNDDVPVIRSPVKPEVRLCVMMCVYDVCVCVCMMCVCVCVMFVYDVSILKLEVFLLRILVRDGWILHYY